MGPIGYLAQHLLDASLLSSMGLAIPKKLYIPIMMVRISASGLSFEGGMPQGKLQHRLLLMLDEFPALRFL
jgi:hypothetical protein